MKRHAAWVGAAVLVAALAAALLSNWRSSDASVSAARLRIAEVTRGTLVRDASVNGRVVAAVSPTLYAKAAATVNLQVAAGDTVKRGQALAVLESPDLSDALKRETSTYEQLKAEVARQQILARKQKLLAQKDADTAEIDRLSAQRTLERYDSVAQVGVIAKIDYQKARDALQSAEIRARHAAQAAALEGDDVQLALKTKTSELERARLSMGEARRRVDELTVRAPVDGFIGTLNVQNRMVVAANAPLMTLVDLSKLEVELEVPETYVADMGLGMHAEIQLPTGTATGKLSALSPEVVKNMVLARVRFDGEQPTGLRQSQRLTARLLIEEKPNVLMLQRGSFVENEGGRYAYVVRDGIATRTPVRLGATSIAAVEILSGLKAGDRVVVSGTDAFDKAERVSINQ
ncbi:efflux RND transporter periplasmic adaptor subunit [Massilia forsythiae]|uniref:efflux RND transporter periplasmic adaptor subunit n=1 Tax=Massilia forsythiae TaxID=2728020 RepID=UPI001E2FE8DB|nr:efflux RND transporter periplasmic adaptor subunit [Massilia forsythiae]